VPADFQNLFKALVVGVDELRDGKFFEKEL